MKRFNFIIAIACMLMTVACNHNNYVSSIKGSVKGVEDGQVIALLNSSMDTIAKTMVKSEKFLLHLKALEEGLYTLDTKDGSFLMLYLQNEDTSVKVEDINDLNSIIVKGGEQTLIYHHLFVNFLQPIEMAVEDDEYEKAVDDLRVEIAKYVKTPVGLYLFYSQVLPQIKYEQALEIIDGISPEDDVYKSDYYTKIEEYMSLWEIILPGKKVLEFDAWDVKNKQHALSEVLDKDKAVLIDFWASWCGPCRRAMVRLKDLYKEYNSKIEFVSVSVDRSRDAWLEAVKEENAPWPMWRDSTNVSSDQYLVSFIPYMVLISKDRDIVAIGNDIDDILEKVKDIDSK